MAEGPPSEPANPSRLGAAAAATGCLLLVLLLAGARGRGPVAHTLAVARPGPPATAARPRLLPTSGASWPGERPPFPHRPPSLPRRAPAARRPVWHTLPSSAFALPVELAALGVVLGIAGLHSLRQPGRHLRVACLAVGRGHRAPPAPPPSVLLVVAAADCRPLAEAVAAAMHRRCPGAAIRLLAAPTDGEETPLLQTSQPPGTDPWSDPQQLAKACSDVESIIVLAADLSLTTKRMLDRLGRALPLCPAPPRLVAYLRGPPPPLPVPYTAVRCAAEDGDAPPPDVAEALADVLQARLVLPRGPLSVQDVPPSPAEGPPSSPPPWAALTSDSRAVQLAVLLSVPVAWGTYGPAVRFMYALEQPVPGLLFATLYYICAFATLATLALLTRRKPAAHSAAPTQRGELSVLQTLRGGAELGGYLFLANCAQLLGLQLTTSGVASFIVQLTTVIVPLLEAFVLKVPVPLLTWGACALSLAGVAVFAGDSLLTEPGAAGWSALRGDALVALSALFYSFHVLRLGTWAPRTEPSILALSKVSFELLYSTALIAALVLLKTGVGAQITAFFAAVMAGAISPGSLQGLAGAAAWCGIVTCAYTMWAQSFGQRRIRPVNANLIYTSQPIWSTVFGFLLLGEGLGPFGLLGAALIAAGLALSLQEQRLEEDATTPP